MYVVGDLQCHSFIIIGVRTSIMATIGTMNAAIAPSSDLIQQLQQKPNREQCIKHFASQFNIQIIYF